MPEEKPISEQIQAIRQQQGLSQEVLARLLGVSFPTVNAWERGKSTPYPRHQKAIRELYAQVQRDTSSQQVLIVEDDPSSAMVLADYVKIALPTRVARVIDNGYEAILQIGLLRPGIVLLDIMMPEIDGLKVFARLKELDELKDTRVIFVTAATDEDILGQARDAGAFALIQKPVKREQIVAALQDAARADQ